MSQLFNLATHKNILIRKPTQKIAIEPMDDLVERELLGEYDMDQVADAHLGIQYDVDGNPSQLIVAELGKGAFINDFAVVSSNMSIPATI